MIINKVKLGLNEVGLGISKGRKLKLKEFSEIELFHSCSNSTYEFINGTAVVGGFILKISNFGIKSGSREFITLSFSKCFFHKWFNESQN